MVPSLKITASEDAYSLYREAQSHWERRTPIAIRLAIRCLERAVALDGTFALACAALADCYSILLDYGVIAPREGLTAAKLAAGRALHEGPELAESLTASALVRQMDLDWSGAEMGFKAAIELHPEYTVARQRYALFLACLGRGEESGREIEQACRLAPESPAVSATAAWVPYYQDRYEESIDAARAAVLKHPGFSSAEVVLALGMVGWGRPDEATLVLERASRREPENVSLLSLLAYSRAREGNVSGAEVLLYRLSDQAKNRYVSPYYLAVLYVGLGREDEALSAVERAVAERAPQVIYLVQEPIFKGLRDRERFQASLARAGLSKRGAGTPNSPGAATGEVA